jgi:hypothetical protein
MQTATAAASQSLRMLNPIPHNMAQGEVTMWADIGVASYSYLSAGAIAFWSGCRWIVGGATSSVTNLLYTAPAPAVEHAPFGEETEMRGEAAV